MNNKIQETAEQTLQRQLEIESSVRELFAKLLATENISVIHTNVPTPCFDLKNRTLKLPDWKGVSKELYVMMIAHEVAHALHTPMDQWEKHISESKSNKRILKDVINVVEDARIEKLIQIRYPGTKRAFLKGYEELLKKFDLFQFDSQSLKSRSLVDRINLYFKVTKYGGPAVPFTQEEKLWILKIESCRSFQDVLDISQELYSDIEKNKEKKKNKSKPNNSESQNSSEKLEESDEIDSSDEQEKSENESKGSSNSDSDSDESSSEKDNQSSGNNKQDDKKDLKKDDSSDEQEESDSQDDSKEPSIQDLLDEAKDQFINKDLDYNGLPKDIHYVNLPISNDKNKCNYIVSYKTVHEQIKNYYSGPAVTMGTYHYDRRRSAQGEQVIIKSAEAFNSFKQKHRGTITSMVNLFEMKKRAALYSRSKTSKTGLLNLNKIHSYKFNDDVFKKMTVTPEGKNHGMVMFIDLSGSMARNIAGTFEQTLILCMFCKKVGIPFDVYGFTNSTFVDFKKDYSTLKDGDFVPEYNFSMRHYLSSKMTLKEFNEYSVNFFALALSHDNGNDVPTQESLGQTPLNSCIAYSYDMIRNFKSNNNLDIVNAIYLTDGDATDSIYFKKTPTDPHSYNRYYNSGYSGNHSDKNLQMAENIIFRNPINGRTWNSTIRDNFYKNKKGDRVRRVARTTPTLLEVVGTLDGVNVIGFFVSQSKYDLSESFREKFKKDGFLKMDDFQGYKNYYIVKGGKNLNVENDSPEFEKGASLRKIRTAYLKSREKTVTNKVLLNKFIENISEY